MSQRQSSYPQYLPAIYQDNAFLDRFLLAFERILTRGDEAQPALGEVIANIDRYFRPLAGDGATDRQAPPEFLPWLAGWVAFSLREDWDEATRRRYLSEIVSLYRRRGTKAGLRRMLQIYLGEETPITIYDTAADFRALDADFAPPPHFFQVEIREKDRDPRAVRHKERVALAIIDREKPAHTTYTLNITIPSMRLLSPQLAAELGEASLILGENSLLGASRQRMGRPFRALQPLQLPFTLGKTSQLGTVPPK
jgi:phage tail-like protein